MQNLQLKRSPSKAEWGEKLRVDPFSAFAARQPNRRPRSLEDDLTTEPDADTYPDSSQTDDQRRRMGSQGSVA